MTLNPQQSAAFDAFVDFLDDPDMTIFALFGAAGTGKSFTAGKLYAEMEYRRGPMSEMLWLAPTWKAVRIAGKFLAENDVFPEIGFDAYIHQMGNMILTTTQQALGIQPVIEDNQTADKIKFGRVNDGVLKKLCPQFVVIDEVSMLSWDHLKQIKEIASQIGCKVLIIGDPNQLPPVEAAEIKWDRLPNKYELSQIMRQSDDSAIPHLGRLILDGGDWQGFTGPGIERVNRATSSFLENVGVPAEIEEDRDIFVAYMNRTVDSVQEDACQRVYGHGKDDFEVGQLLLAQSALYVDRRGMVVANQDEIRIESIDGPGRWGVSVLIRNSYGQPVRTELLTARELNDKGNPYNQVLDGLRSKALELQTEWNSYGKKERQHQPGLDTRRREAWKAFFVQKDQTVLSYAHPFAITSHKSQGSSYRNTWIAAQEIAKFSDRGLYVAATRARENLIL